MKQYKVSNMKSENGTVELRIISARQPLEHARLVRPNLEDVFCIILEKRVVTWNDSI